MNSTFPNAQLPNSTELYPDTAGDLEVFLYGPVVSSSNRPLVYCIAWPVSAPYNPTITPYRVLGVYSSRQQGNPAAFETEWAKLGPLTTDVDIVRGLPKISLGMMSLQARNTLTALALHLPTYSNGMWIRGKEWIRMLLGDAVRRNLLNLNIDDAVRRVSAADRHTSRSFPMTFASARSSISMR